MEFFIAWYSGNPYERFTFLNRAFGPYWWAYWTMITCNVLVAAALLVQEDAHERAGDVRHLDLRQHRHVVRALRDHRDSLHRDFLPSSWGYFRPTWVDILTFVGTFGLFFTLFLLFVRFLPMIAIVEVKGVMASDKMHRSTTGSARASARSSQTS